MSAVPRTLLPAPASARPLAPAPHGASDAQLVKLWLHGRSPHTQRAYRANVDRFLAFDAAPLPTITLGDLQAFAHTPEDLAPSPRIRPLAAIKSLLAFGQRTGYLSLNVGAALKLPTSKNTLAERILSETQVHRLVALEPSKRNQALPTRAVVVRSRSSHQEIACVRIEQQDRSIRSHTLAVI